MKQAMALALAAAMALSLAGCGEPASASQSVSQPASVSQPESASQPASASQPESAPVSVPAPTGESYFDANGIPVLDEPSNFEVHAIAYDMEDSTIQRPVSAKGTAHAVVATVILHWYRPKNTKIEPIRTQLVQNLLSQSATYPTITHGAEEIILEFELEAEAVGAV